MILGMREEAGKEIYYRSESKNQFWCFHFSDGGRRSYFVHPPVTYLSPVRHYTLLQVTPYFRCFTSFVCHSKFFQFLLSNQVEHLSKGLQFLHMIWMCTVLKEEIGGGRSHFYRLAVLF